MLQWFVFIEKHSEMENAETQHSIAIIKSSIFHNTLPNFQCLTISQDGQCCYNKENALADIYPRFLFMHSLYANTTTIVIVLSRSSLCTSLPARQDSGTLTPNK